jgi:hypothetical protein
MTTRHLLPRRTRRTPFRRRSTARYRIGEATIADAILFVEQIQ